MASSNTFPAFIRAEYDPSGNGFAQFERAGTEATSRFQRTLDASLRDVGKNLASSLSGALNKAGSLDLDVGKIRQAAAAAQIEAAAKREVAEAAERAAAKETANSEAARLYAQTARAAAIEAESNANALNQQAAAMDRVQAELNTTQSRTAALIQSNRGLTQEVTRGTAASGASRFAYIQLGQQLQDITVSLASGQRAAVVFAQQIPQAALALTGFGGTVGRVATFLSGPWGAAIFGATTVLGLLAPALLGAGDASDEMADKQKSLADYIDKTTGSIDRQISAMQRLAAAEKTRSAARQSRADVLGARAEILSQLDATIASRGTRAGTQRQQRTGQSVGASREAVVAARDLFAAGGSTEALVTALNRIADADPRVRKLASSMTLLGGRVADASAEGARFEAQLRLNAGRATEADRVLLGLGNALADAAQRNVELATATTAVERAQIAYNAYVRDGAKTIDGVKVKQADYEARLLSLKQTLDTARKAEEDARNAVREHNEVTREAEKLAREAEAANRALEASYSRLARNLDPVTAANREYAQTLREIDALRTAGKIMQGEAVQLDIEAVARQRDAITQAYTDSARKTYADAGIDPAAGIRQFVDGSDALREAAADAAETLRTNGVEAVNEVARAFENIFGGKIGRTISSVTSILGSPGGSGGLLSLFGGGSGDPYGGYTPAQLREMDELPAGVGQLRGDTATDLVSFLNRAGEKFGQRLAGDVGAGIGKRLGDALAGAGIGATAGGLILGSNNSKAGSAIGGALGNTIGEKLSKTFGKQLGKLGDFAGPLGSIAGGIIGGAVGKLFSKTPKASSTIGFDASGRLVVSSTTGTKKLQAATASAADSAISTVERIAEQLGGTLRNGVGAVSLGIRNGNYRVDPTGSGATKVKRGAVDFGDDAEAAVKYATLDLIKDGIIAGLRGSTQRLLQQSKDLDAAVDKAVRFEGVFTRLKQHLDPVGAATDALNKEFTSLKALFTEAGASAEEFAQLEQLYGIERKKAIEDASSAMTSALRGLLDELNTGDNGLSLRDRLTNALKTYNPLAADIRAGRSVDYDTFAEAARTVLDIQRQLSGSQSDYFSRLGEVTDLTKLALQAQENVISIATGKTTPFDGVTTAPGPAAANSNAPVVNGLSAVEQAVANGLAAVNANLGKLIASGGIGNGGGRSGVARGFDDRANF